MQLSVLSLVLIVFFCPIFGGKKRGRSKDQPCVKNLCSEYPGYPSDKIDKLLSQSKISYLKTTNTVIKPVKKPNILIKTRIFESKEENLCKTRRMTRLPKYHTKTQLFIVNTKNFTQQVTFELCSREKGKCQYDSILNLSIFCKQVYTKVYLLYYDNEQLNYGLFTIPNACVCVYKKNYSKESP